MLSFILVLEKVIVFGNNISLTGNLKIICNVQRRFFLRLQVHIIVLLYNDEIYLLGYSHGQAAP